MGEAVEDVRAVALRHATDDTDDDAGVSLLAVAEFTEARPHLLLGVLTDGAGVVKDHVRVVAGFDGRVALGAELAHDELAVEHVHLAAERFEVNLAWHIAEAELVHRRDAESAEKERRF